MGRCLRWKEKFRRTHPSKGVFFVTMTSLISFWLSVITPWVKQHAVGEQWDLDESRPAPPQESSVSESCSPEVQLLGSDGMMGLQITMARKTPGLLVHFALPKNTTHFFYAFLAHLQGRWDQMRHRMPLSQSDILSARSPFWCSAWHEKRTCQGSWLKEPVSEHYRVMKWTARL